MDSCVTLALTLEPGYSLAALHVNYGQHTERRELQSFHDLCTYYNISNKLVVDITHLAQIGGSSLIRADIQVPGAMVEPGAVVQGMNPVGWDSERGTIPNTYVPFRNANILAIATSWAEVIGAHAISIGAVEEDSSGYPDCRESFFKAFEKAISEGTRPGSEIHILSPVIHLRKLEIVREGQRLHAPFHLTWSCYRNEAEACGDCDSCRLRLKGFSEAGIPDPIPYH
jgi:7-cyano-7-deazaguanine synthase